MHNLVPFPGPSMSDGSYGEVVQSLTYRESRLPVEPFTGSARPPGRLLDDAPPLARTAACAAWAVVMVVAAGGLSVVLLLATARVVGWLA
jgi:hypothetical protein